MELVLRFKIHCKDCKKLKAMYEDAARAEKPGRRIMYDVKGRRWNGRQCYDCKQLSKRVTPQDSPANVPGKEKTMDSGLDGKLRYCRRDHGGCGKLMPATRYFLCVTCQPTLDDDAGDFCYS